MFDSLRNALPLITGTLFVVALLLFAVSFRLFRRSRTDIFWRRRRDAGQRGWRLFVLAATLVVFSTVSCIMTLVSGTLLGNGKAKPGPTAVAQLSESPTPLETRSIGPDGAATPSLETPVQPGDTPSPLVVIVTATPIFTPTETPFPTFTANAPPPVSSVTPLPDATLRITALDDQISDAHTPINPRTTFSAGVRRIYMFVEYTSMTRGLLWRRVLLRDNTPIDTGTYTWGLESAGTTYFFFGDDAGLQPGAYEIRLFIGESAVPVSIVPFTVAPAP